MNRKVVGTNDLVAHVAHDPEVADRYQRHFAMDRERLLGYLKGLHRGTLGQPGSYTVYSVPRGGRLKMHLERLPKGEPMFLDAEGRPTLIVKCGNPVVLGPERSLRANPVALAPDDGSGLRTRSGEEAAALPSDVMALMPDVSETIALTPRDDSLSETPLFTGPAPEVPAFPETPPGLMGIALPALASIPLGTAHFGGGHTQSTPEPSALVALALGAGFVRWRRRA